MKAYLLISLLIQDPIAYESKSMCQEAADALQAMDETSVCIPAGNYTKPKDSLETMLDFVIKMQNMPPKEVDIQEE
jgi:hypothetical protein|tara:strand:- start:220 stop:447 length:228 start_codon:yes stop_codon:yes gene_type:complete